MAYRWPGWCHGFNTQAAVACHDPLTGPPTSRPLGALRGWQLTVGTFGSTWWFQQGPAVTGLREEARPLVLLLPDSVCPHKALSHQGDASGLRTHGSPSGSDPFCTSGNELNRNIIFQRDPPPLDSLPPAEVSLVLPGWPLTRLRTGPACWDELELQVATDSLGRWPTASSVVGASLKEGEPGSISRPWRVYPARCPVLRLPPVTSYNQREMIPRILSFCPVSFRCTFCVGWHALLMSGDSRLGFLWRLGIPPTSQRCAVKSVGVSKLSWSERVYVSGLANERRPVRGGSLLAP